MGRSERLEERQQDINLTRPYRRCVQIIQSYLPGSAKVHAQSSISIIHGSVGPTMMSPERHLGRFSCFRC